MSTAVTLQLGTANAIVQAMHPEPVHKSRILTGTAFLPYGILIRDILEAVLMASRHRSSVSGRGISTPGVTLNLRP